MTPENCEAAYAKYKDLPEKRKEGCRWLEHKRWVRFHVVNNWSYSSVRDNSQRHHPLLVPYEELTREEQILDDSAWELLGEIK